VAFLLHGYLEEKTSRILSRFWWSIYRST